MGLAKGSKTAITLAGEEFGMNKDVLGAVIAAARRDTTGTLTALHKIGVNGTIGAAAEKLKVLYRLAQKQNESSLRLALKEAIVCSETINNSNSHELESIVAVGRYVINFFRHDL